RALRGGEHGGILARLDHVRVPHQGVVARALLAERGLGLLEEPRPRLGPELGEGGGPFGERQPPELIGRPVDPVRPRNCHDPALSLERVLTSSWRIVVWLGHPRAGCPHVSYAAR